MLPNTIRMRNKTNINANQRQKNERRITSKKKSVDPKKKRERMKKKDNELNTKRNIDLGDWGRSTFVKNLANMAVTFAKVFTIHGFHVDITQRTQTRGDTRA